MKFRWEWAVLAVGLVVFAIGQYLGLVWAPREMMMGEVGRILYVHVPAAWVAMLAYTLAFGCALGTLFTNKPAFDWGLEATVEVGNVLCALLLVLGMFFARPTWGVWWDWDPRLTSSLVMWLTFVGITMLRQFVEDPDKRATWSAAASILAFVNIPVTYMSVRWWRSLHQVQSSARTLSDDMVFALGVNSVAFMLLMVYYIVARYRVAQARFEAAAPEPLPGGAR